MGNKYDAIIVGAGPAGAYLAYQLQKTGFSTAIIEMKHQLKRKVCGEYLCPKGVELIRQQGLDMHLLSGFKPLVGMNIYTAKDTKVHTDFPCDSSQNFGVALNRLEFDQRVLDLALNAGANCFMGTAVKSIVRDSKYWIVRTSKGDYSGKLLVGADGRTSTISKLLNNEVPASSNRIALHAYLPADEEANTHGEMHLFEDGAYIGLNPISKDEVNLSLVVDSSRIKDFASIKECFQNYIDQSESLSKRYSLSDEDLRITSAYPITHKTKSIHPDKMVALVGDAAGFIDPLTGEGIYNALLSAKLLADCLKQSRDFIFTNNDTALKAYEHAYVKKLKQKSRLNWFFQWLIKKPKFVEWVARYLLKRKSRADAFIGLIGNIYSPFDGLIKLIF